MKIKLTQNKEAEIDDTDYDLIKGYNWYAINNHDKWYAATRIKSSGRKIITLHRLLMNTSNSKELVDHIDGDGLNCKRNNMRIATRRGNSTNKKASKNGSSKYLGVCIVKQTFKWGIQHSIRANIPVNRKTIHLGNYKTEIEAAKAYDTAAKKYYGEFANLNFKENL